MLPSLGRLYIRGQPPSTGVVAAATVASAGLAVGWACDVDDAGGAVVAGLAAGGDWPAATAVR